MKENMKDLELDSGKMAQYMQDNGETHKPMAKVSFYTL